VAQVDENGAMDSDEIAKDYTGLGITPVAGTEHGGYKATGDGKRDKTQEYLHN
jgi:hypothetical protein